MSQAYKALDTSTVLIRRDGAIFKEFTFKLKLVIRFEIIGNFSLAGLRSPLYPPQYPYSMLGPDQLAAW